MLAVEADQGVALVIVFREMIEGDPSRNEISRCLNVPTNVKNARSWQQACTMQSFITTTDADIAEDGDQRQVEQASLITGVQKLERRWT